MDAYEWRERGLELDRAQKIRVGFAWEQYERQRSRGLIAAALSPMKTAVDCDASAFVLGKNGDGTPALLGCASCGELRVLGGSVVHRGDDRTGLGDGDDEQIDVDLDRLPEEAERIVFTLDLFKEKRFRLGLGGLSSVYVRITDRERGGELCRFDLRGSVQKAVSMCALRRSGNGWRVIETMADLDAGNRDELAESLLAFF
ncbi:MAG: TerD family protein [Oscillospiraceae bacterium]|nr:TerD family protein [Oscillospiraceae bacterium]